MTAALNDTVPDGEDPNFGRVGPSVKGAQPSRMPTVWSGAGSSSSVTARRRARA